MSVILNNPIFIDTTHIIICQHKYSQDIIIIDTFSLDYCDLYNKN